MVKHFKIPELEKESKKSGADTNAVNPAAQNENNKINTLNVAGDKNPENGNSTLPRITPDKRENKTPIFRPR